jgi:hypothetical protein
MLSNTHRFIRRLITTFGWKTAIEIGHSEGIGSISMCLAGVETVLNINPIVTETTINNIKKWGFTDRIRHIKLTFGETQQGLTNVAPMQLAYLNDDFPISGAQIEQVMSKCQYMLFYNSHQHFEMRRLKDSLILSGLSYLDIIAPDRVNSNMGNFDNLYEYWSGESFISITLIRGR